MPRLVNKTIVENLPYEIMYKLNVKQDVDEYLAYQSLKRVFDIQEEKVRSTFLGMILSGMMVKGAKLEEIIGLLNAALSLDNISIKSKPKIKLPEGERLLGYAGSGKKGIKTINISTPASIVAASCGVYVAKACSHSTSSLTGSSDFLDNLGININLQMGKKIDGLKNIGIAFFSIEDTTPRFAQIYGGRFYAPHALSYALAGLSLPISIDVMAYGLSHQNIQLSIEVFKHYGFNNVMVFNTTEDGIHYIDEVGVSGSLNLVGVKDGVLGRSAICSISEELDFKNKYTMYDIRQKKSIYENIRQIVLAITGQGNQALIDVIAVNAGLLIYLSRKTKSLKQGYFLAKENIMSGKAYKKLQEIIDIYEGCKEDLKKWFI